MTDRFQKRTSSILATTLIGIIIIAFAFGGVDSFVQQPDSVGSVGKYPIPIREYERTLQQQIDYYKQMFGGRDLTSKQIEQFNLRQGTFDSLVNKKLMYILADEIGIAPSSSEVKNTIKELPYFQNEQKAFDLQRYKTLLQANQFTPQNFEAEISNDLKLEHLMPVLSNVQISPKLAEALSNLKQRGFALSGIQMAKKEIEKAVDVSQAKIDEYLKDKENLKRVENLFASRKESLNQAEQVLASHILIRIEPGKEPEALKKIQEIQKQATSKNFKKLAEKNTEDPTGKTNGGSLGWFSKGRMVPEFEKVAFSLKSGSISTPIKTNFGYHLIYVEDKKEAKIATIDEYRNVIAKELIQKDDKDGIKSLTTSLASQFEAALKANDQKLIEQLKKQHVFTQETAGKLNKIDGAVGRLTLTDVQVNAIFKESSVKNIFVFDEPLYLYVIKIDPKQTEGVVDLKKEQEILAQNSLQKLQTDLLAQLKKNTKIKMFNKLL